MKKRYYFQNILLSSGFIFSLLVLFIGLYFEKKAGDYINSCVKWLLRHWDWFFQVVGVWVVLVIIILYFSRIGKIKLGDTEPEYGLFSWIALLFSTGMGSGLLLRAVQEPVYYYQHPPVASGSDHVLALQYTFFHWGITPWTFYSLFGLMVAYSIYNHKVATFDRPLSLLKNRTLIACSNVFMILITITGVVATLGLGMGQFVEGLNSFLYLNWKSEALFWIVLLTGVAATLSALTGLKRIIKYLANFDLVFSILILLLIAYYLDFNEVIGWGLSATGSYFLHFFQMNLSLDPFRASSEFTQNWTVFYWAFWLAWAPFTGIFMARISKGRSVRSYLLGTVFVPTIATLAWFFVFGSSGILLIEKGAASSTEFNEVFSSIFNFLRHYPLLNWTLPLTSLLILLSIINSVDSSIYVLSMFSDEGGENPQASHKLIWGAILTVTALGLLLIGEQNLLQSISNLLILMALPFSFVYIYFSFLFLKRVFSKNSQ